MADEIKGAIDAVTRAIAEQREELAKGRSADQEKLAKIEKELNRFDEIKAEMDKRAAADKARADAIEAKLNRMELGGAGGEGAKKGEEAKAAFMAAIRGGAEKLSADERKALSLSNDTTGGLFAPAEFVNDIIKAVVLVSPMRSLVTVRTTGSAEVQIPKRTATAAATRTGEGSTRSETTNPAWGLVKIPAPEMYAEARVTWMDLEDAAVNLEALLTDEFAEQFGLKEGQEVISGTGINQCLGFLDANAAGPGVPIAYTASGQAATIKGAAGSEADALVDFFHAVKTAYAANGTWVFNRKTLGILRKLKDTTGQFIWQAGFGNSGSVANGPAATILGAPYVECPDMPDEAANAFPIAFGDWKRAYTLVDRVGVTVTRDPLTLANVGQVKIFARRRVGGQVVLGEAVRLFKCAAS